MDTITTFVRLACTRKAFAMQSNVQKNSEYGWFRNAKEIAVPIIASAIANEKLAFSTQSISFSIAFFNMSNLAIVTKTKVRKIISPGKPTSLANFK